MINAEKYAEQIATIIADNTKCKYWVKEKNEYGYPNCEKCAFKREECANKKKVHKWLLSQCE